MQSKKFGLGVSKILTIGVTTTVIFGAAFTTSCSTKKEDETDEQYFSHFKPVLRFTVVSDAHISAYTTHLKHLQKFEDVYKDSYEYAQSQEYKGFDHVFVVGDGADDCYDLEGKSIQKFADAVKEQSAKYNVETHAILGNHELTSGLEFELDYNKIVNIWKQKMHYDAIDFHIKLGDYHFIMFSPRDQFWMYDEDNLAPWLEGEIQKALADDPTKTKPIFVFQHIGIKDTVYKTPASYMKRLKNPADPDSEVIPAYVINNVFKKYPQVVDFSGHSHAPITDPRAIYQKEYTAIATGSLCYFNMDLAGNPEYQTSVFSTPNSGGEWWSGIDPLLDGDDGNQFSIYELDKNGAMKMMIRDAYSHQQIGDPYCFRSFGNPSKFKYTEERKNTDPAPKFDYTSETPKELTKSSVRFDLKQAKYAQNYRCEIFKKSSNQSKTNELETIYRLSDNWLSSQPATFKVNFGDKENPLDPNTNYEIKVTPINSWGKEGVPLILSFKTPEA